eukprot:2623384-Pyramimonas_sp.AAC.1
MVSTAAPITSSQSQRQIRFLWNAHPPSPSLAAPPAAVGWRRLFVGVIGYARIGKRAWDVRRDRNASPSVVMCRGHAMPPVGYI